MCEGSRDVHNTTFEHLEHLSEASRRRSKHCNTANELNLLAEIHWPLTADQYSSVYTHSQHV